MQRLRILLGTLISAAFIVAIGAIYYFIAKFLDRVIGLSFFDIPTPALWLLAGILWSFGLFWILWAYSYLIFVGSGSPLEAFGAALEPTKRLVTAGPYAYVRNPIVFGLLIIFFGVAFFGNSISGLILVPVSALLFVLYGYLFEERALTRRFGVEYHHYRDHVPMLIPRPYAYVPPDVQV